MKIAYADPPYPGLAHLYADQPEYSGEIDHAALIARLDAEFDGWVLHTHSPAIPIIAALVPEGARWAAWVKTFAAFKKGVRPAYAWEPVVFKPCRRMIARPTDGCSVTKAPPPLSGETVLWHGPGTNVALHPSCAVDLGARLCRDGINAKLLAEGKPVTAGIGVGLVASGG